jgi:DNA-binding MarR family transcriptional regulator
MHVSSPQSGPDVSAERRDDAITLIRRVNRFLRAGDLDDATIGELTLAQLRVLFRLRNRGPMPSSQLAGGLGVTLPTVTSVIDRLVGKNLVDRTDDASDRRRVIVGVSAAGRETVERVQQGRRARLARALEALDERELLALVTGLEALATAADALDRTEPEPAIAS